MPPKRVIWSKDEQVEIMGQLYEESGHRGKKGTHDKFALRYWWKGLYRGVEIDFDVQRMPEKIFSIRITEERPTLENSQSRTFKGKGVSGKANPTSEISNHTKKPPNPTTRAIVLHADQTIYKPRKIHRWIEEDNNKTDQNYGYAGCSGRKKGR
ncbi:hypothetical protein BGX38DRAFT_1276796 [Terfezia claveryi]|nr:hypothetical protein BGX38DRAFT_1276796 [Terfezia claveryi]